MNLPAAPLRVPVTTAIPAALAVAGIALLAWATGIFSPPGPASSPPTSSASTSRATHAPVPAVTARSPQPAADPGGWAAAVPSDRPAPASTRSHRSGPPATKGTTDEAAPMDQGGPPDPADAPAGAKEVIAVAPNSRRGKQAVAIAERFTQAYAAPTGEITPRRWWQAVAALLSEQARADYAGVDPTRVPWTRRSGPGRLVPLGDGTTPVVAVQVPTDAGAVTVHLVPEPRRGWVVTRADMPTRPR